MYDTLTTILREKFQVDEAMVTPDITLEEMGLDSLDVVELCIVLENELDIKIVDDEIIGAERMDAIIDLLTERLATTAR